MPSSPRLDVDRLHPPHLLDAAELDVLSGCARVRLSTDYVSPETFRIEDGATQALADLLWTAPSDVQRRTYPLKKATEDGAVACAFVALDHIAGLAAYVRCEDGFHADYFMLEKDRPQADLEHCTLLEVSGVGRGGSRAVAGRMRKRSRRLRRRRRHIDNPAMTAVIGFDSRIIRIQREASDGLA